DADKMLTGALKTHFAVAENYPQLKANQNYLQLQDELTHTENKVSFSRQFFNDSVLTYNNAVESFPGNLFAGIYGRKQRDMLTIPEAERAVPKVSFA
ncbi:MAG: LemA family protein, partial [Euryarchaeota archaeon]|nr:LemA family protein [Euryarchaeota archaeon]